MRRDLPAGTVTFLFTDVEGSTKLLHELGAETYAEKLAEHRNVVRQACTTRGGFEVDTQGDAFFVAFPTAPGALEAARSITAELASGPITLRIGLHTGAPLLTEEGYVGEDVHFAARVAASAHGGQVILSQATCALLDDRYPLVELGEHRLKDIAEPVAIFQLGHGAFPPLKTISNTNFPRPASSFVGREREVQELLACIESGSRLVTLSGPGGSGKTRLALEAASTLVPQYKAGAFWVGLASLSDAALVTETIEQTLGARDGLAPHIGERQMLLLLDNLEQVIEVAAELTALLASCPNLTLIVTSRELLRIQGEIEYPVPPLAEVEAVSLFCERAQTAASEEIAELCRRLDNLPLAVELAAARAKVLSPAQLLERLSQRLDLLRGGRDADPRQQTLRATIAWSYQLLSVEEQRLFRRLAVFAGSCSLSSAERVCDADLATLESLIDKSLVRQRERGRLGMLETIREFAAEAAAEAGEREAMRRGHAEHFLKLVDPAEGNVDSADDERLALARLERDNLRSALEFCLESGDAHLGLRLAVALEPFWPIAPSEGMRWFDRLLAAAPRAPLHLRAQALRAYGGAANPAGNDALAERLYRESHDAFRAAGDDRSAAHLAMRLGHSALYRGDHTSARTLAEQSLAESRNFGDQMTESQSLGLLGDLECIQGDREHGIRLLKDSAALADEIGFTWWRVAMLGKLVDQELDAGLRAEATQHAREALRLAAAQGDRLRTVRGLARLARIESDSGARPQHAGRLWGAIEAEENRGPIGAWDAERERFAQAVLAHAGPEFERGRDDGHALSLVDAVAEALGAD